MAETVKGGRYKVGDSIVNAAGEEMKGAGAPPQNENGGSGGALEGVVFASEEAARLASEKGLTADDFKMQRGSGSEGGFTKPDVQRISDSRSA